MAAIGAVGRETRDTREDEYWAQGLAYYRRASFQIRATPLRTTDPALGILSSVALAEEHFKACSQLYPEFSGAVDTATRALSDVFHAALDPLTEAVTTIRTSDPDGRAGVVLATSSLEAPVQSHLRQATGDSGIDVVTPRELAARRPYNTLCVIGSPAWYVRHGWGWVFTAPRSSRLWLVGYEADATRSLPSARALSDSRSTGLFPGHDVPAQPAQPDADSDSDSDFEIDWKLVSDRLAREVSIGQGGETVDARLYVLAGGWGTFLSESDDSRVQALEPDAPPGARIVSIAPRDLEPGSFVLLRSEGGGDLVVIVADSVLGEAAPTLRGMQAEWKARLRQLVDDQGYAQVVAALKEAGSNVASRANVAHWCWPRSLRTWDRSDFDAIMEVTGLGDEADSYWTAMGNLDAAHRRAGFVIREKLEEQAERADLEILETSGMANFSLPEGGGALTAYRVEDVAGSTVLIGEPHLGRPFRMKA